MLQEVNRELVSDLSHAVEAKDEFFIKARLAGMHATDISEVISVLENEAGKFIVGLLGKQMGADIISNLDPDTRIEFLKLFSSAEVAEFMDLTDSDDAADILNVQHVKVREEVIALMKNHEKANYIVDLLHYEDDCAGGLMAKEIIKANINWSMKQCVEEIRRQADKVDKILVIYVVDDFNVLLGRVMPKKIILSRTETLISEVYTPDTTSVQTYDSHSEVAEVMQKYDLEVIPVVNARGQLLGRITIDDVLDVITEQADREQQIMAGISEDVEEDDSVWTLSRARLPWLIIGMMGGLLGAQFIGFFERDLTIIPAMAFFIPLITATGGNVGIQSSTIVVQALAGNTPFISSFERLIKVLLVAIINGLVISGIVFVFNLFFADSNLAAVVSVALFSVVLLASFMGTVTPIVLHRMGINPALASGTFITTANDLLGLAVYFMIARLLYASI